MEQCLKLIDNTDKVTFVIIVVMNTLLWKKKMNSCLIYILIVILIGFILPLLSSGREVDRNVALNGPAMDNFELLYTFFVFPVYWFVLILQVIYISIKPNSIIEEVNKDILDRN